MPKREKIKSGYKLSSLGSIPFEWDAAELKTVVEKIGSGITPTGGEKVYKTNGKPFLRSQNVGWGTLLLDDVAFIDDKTHNSFKSTEIKEGDVLLNITGASIGRSTIADRRVKGGNVNQHVCIIRTIHTKLYPYFLNSFLLSQKGQNLIDSYQAGGNRQGLNFEQIRSFKVPIPPLREQTAIANLLSTWDRAITHTTQLITQKELRKKWLMQQLLTGKKRLRGFKGKWKEGRIRDTCELTNGMVFKPNEWSNKGIPIIRIQNLNGSVEFNYFDKEYDKRYLIRNGDVLFAWSGSRGTSFGSFVWGGKSAILNQHIFKVVPKKEITKDLLFLILRLLTIRIETKAHGSAGLVHVTKGQLEKEKLFYPSDKDEQTAIAKVLQSSDAELNLLRKKLDKLKEQKKGLMQELLTGKKRLKIKL